MSARDALSQSLWDNYTRSETNAFIDAHRDEVALEIGRDALRDGLAPTLIRLVGEANAVKLLADSAPDARVTAEPLIHSGLTDVLDDTHPLAHETIYCGTPACTEMLHHCINENMQTWVEAPKGNYCLPCFTTLDEAKGVDGWSGE